MAQFHVYRIAPGRFVMDLQTDLIDTGTRVVAPLIALNDGPRPLPHLEPVIEIEGAAYALHTAEMAAIPTARFVGDAILDLTGRDYELRRALDMVFSGF